MNEGACLAIKYVINLHFDSNFSAILILFSILCVIYEQISIVSIL